MFRVTYFVDDRRLGDTLRALTGLAKGHPEVQPVSNLESPTKLKPASNGGSMVEQFAAVLKANPPTEAITSDFAGRFLKTIGMSPSSKNHLLTEAVRAGLLKKATKTPGQPSIWVLK